MELDQQIEMRARPPAVRASEPMVAQTEAIDIFRANKEVADGIKKNILDDNKHRFDGL